MDWKSVFFHPGDSGRAASAGLVVLRVCAGSMMALGHGLPKLTKFSALAGQFPDPLHIGSRLSLAGAVGAEFFCALLIVVGLATRLACLPLVFTMGIAAFLIHGSDPWFLAPGVAKARELALLYLVPFAVLLIAGPGACSVDGLIRGRNR